VGLFSWLALARNRHYGVAKVQMMDLYMIFVLSGGANIRDWHRPNTNQSWKRKHLLCKFS
jgi:hypothetical protein